MIQILLGFIEKERKLENMNRLLFFSGGLSSFAVAHYLKTEYPNDNIILYFTDTKWEDEDLYRFIYDVSDKLELPMLIHSKGIDPVQLMIKQKILFNNRFGQCSLQLKMKTASDFIRKGKVPIKQKWVNKKYLKDENILDNPILYFGISFDEFHRTKAIARNWEPFQVEFPLTKMFFDYDKLLEQYKIDKPRMYLKGFTHNNCKGRCVKAGAGHFKLLFNEDNETFNQIEEIETTLSLFISTYHEWKTDESKKDILDQNEKEVILWHDTDYKHKPKLILAETNRSYSFMKTKSLKDIGNQMRVHDKLDLFSEEMGGCGCFVDYDEQDINLFELDI